LLELLLERTAGWTNERRCRRSHDRETGQTNWAAQAMPLKVFDAQLI
jgi:hypothetical protein